MRAIYDLLLIFGIEAFDAKSSDGGGGKPEGTGAKGDGPPGGGGALDKSDDDGDDTLVEEGEGGASDVGAAIMALLSEQLDSDVSAMKHC